MLGNIGTPEIIVLAIVIFLLFGGKKLPEIARGISNASQEFAKGLKGEEKSDKKQDKNS
jgi:sec-independent protein translocase protein TatA